VYERTRRRPMILRSSRGVNARRELAILNAVRRRSTRRRTYANAGADVEPGRRASGPANRLGLATRQEPDRFLRGGGSASCRRISRNACACRGGVAAGVSTISETVRSLRPISTSWSASRSSRISRHSPELGGRAAVPRQHPALFSGQAAGNHERDWSRVAQAHASGAAAAVDDRYQVGISIERARLAEDATRLARAEERTRLAREIHDTLAQGLTAIALNIEGAMHDPD